MKNAEEKREERWIAFKKELTELVKNHNVEITLEYNSNAYTTNCFIAFDFKNDESKEWEEGSNDYFQRRCNHIG